MTGTGSRCRLSAADDRIRATPLILLLSVSGSFACRSLRLSRRLSSQMSTNEPTRSNFCCVQPSQTISRTSCGLVMMTHRVVLAREKLRIMVSVDCDRNVDSSVINTGLSINQSINQYNFRSGLNRQTIPRFTRVSQ